MITDKLLLKNGYKRYSDDVYTSLCFFQKRIKDKKGTKYFINIHKYMFYLHDNKPSYEVRLYLEKEKYSIELILFSFRDMTLEDIENEVEELWKKLELKYYMED